MSCQHIDSQRPWSVQALVWHYECGLLSTCRRVRRRRWCRVGISTFHMTAHARNTTYTVSVRIVACLFGWLFGGIVMRIGCVAHNATRAFFSLPRTETTNGCDCAQGRVKLFGVSPFSAQGRVKLFGVSPFSHELLICSSKHFPMAKRSATFCERFAAATL